MRPRNVWQALARLGFVWSWWPVRSAAYLLGTGVLGLLVLVAALLVIAVGGLLTVVVIGIPLLAALPLIGLPAAGLERRLLRLVDGQPVPHGHRVPPRPGLRSWLRTRYTEPGTWREFGYVSLCALVLWPLDLLAFVLGVTVPLALLATPVLFATIGDEDQVNVLKAYAVTSWPGAWASCLAGVAALAVCAYGLGMLAGLRAELARAILAPAAGWLDRQVVELTRSRVRLTDAFEAERSRIERDLHDGAQQRLVALTMMLGVARLDVPPGPLADQLSRAQDEAGRALIELRELIRGVYPPLLTDFGLEAAVTDLATRSAIRVDVDFGVTQRFPRPVESAAYFVVSEALANMAKHSGADRGRIFGAYAKGILTVQVHDDGRGGADIGTGTGLIRLADRVSVVDGRLSLSSPPGGPTRVVVEIPCQTLPDSA
ncbi:sensor domain-containing protein [Micromonospora sp. NPDC049044]|uniref:sensor histidine kinase n=1 Tax=unclassified Micromonospora TaxID=2617518 RepID=UPI0033F5AC22